LDSGLVGEIETETLAWLVGALKLAHARGQRMLVGYFEAVVEDVGGKYEARKTPERLSATLRDETDLDAVSDVLIGVIRETMQPVHLSLWLRPYTTSKGRQINKL
jgi:hypothetical protein